MSKCENNHLNLTHTHTRVCVCARALAVGNKLDRESLDSLFNVNFLFTNCKVIVFMLRCIDDPSR